MNVCEALPLLGERCLNDECAAGLKCRAGSCVEDDEPLFCPLWAPSDAAASTSKARQFEDALRVVFGEARIEFDDACSGETLGLCAC